jgi:hypothetical protein
VRVVIKESVVRNDNSRYLLSVGMRIKTYKEIVQVTAEKKHLLCRRVSYVLAREKASPLIFRREIRFFDTDA